MVRRLASVAAALVCAVVVAVWLAAFFEHDSCADAGGVYMALTGACLVEPGTLYIPQFSRPNLYAFWAIFLALVALPAWLAYRCSDFLFNRIWARVGAWVSRRQHEG
jgi:hypothetical protein